MSRIASRLKTMRARAIARHELDFLSSRQLRDINVERVRVIDGPVYRRRVWNAH